MAEPSASADNGWELAGGVRVERTDKGWSMLGGWEEDDAVGFRLVLHHPESDEVIRRLEIVVPVALGEDGQVEIGEPRVV